jgi:hypothetical protein
MVRGPTPATREDMIDDLANRCEPLDYGNCCGMQWLAGREGIDVWRLKPSLRIFLMKMNVTDVAGNG